MDNVDKNFYTGMKNLADELIKIKYEYDLHLFYFNLIEWGKCKILANAFSYILH